MKRALLRVRTRCALWVFPTFGCSWFRLLFSFCIGLALARSESRCLSLCNRENCILGQGTRFMILQHPRLLAVRDEFALVRGQFHVISVLDCEQLIIDTLRPYLLPAL